MGIRDSLGEALIQIGNQWNSVPFGIRGRIEGSFQTGLGVLTTAWGVGEAIAGGVACPVSGVGCIGVPLGVSDVIGGVQDVELGILQTITNKNLGGGFYPIDEAIISVSPNTTIATVGLIAVGMDPKGLVKGGKRIVNNLTEIVRKETKKPQQIIPMFDQHFYTSVKKGRGWTEELVTKTINGNYLFRKETIDKTTGEKAMAYFIGENQYVVINSKTNRVVQISNLNNPLWRVDSSIGGKSF